MTTETILTDEEIQRIGLEMPAMPLKGSLIEFARAIEQAVLKSLPVQTSSTIRGDSYAGVYIWWGRDNITQHIPKRLAENESNPHGLLECVAAECIRDLEQAVLQSPEIQALRKDAERIEWLEAQTKKSYTGISFDYRRYVEDGYVVDHGYRFMRRHFASGYMDSLRKAIDAAMEDQNEHTRQD